MAERRHARARLAGALAVCLAAGSSAVIRADHRGGAPESPDRSPGAATSRARPTVGPGGPRVEARGSEAWRLSRPARRGQIEGYATTSSGPAGSEVELRVSTVAHDYRVLAYRIGDYAGGTGLRVWRSSWLTGRVQPGPRFSDAARRTVVAP